MKDAAHDEYMAATYRSNPRYAACIFKELMFSAASPRELAIFFRQIRMAITLNQ